MSRPDPRFFDPRFFHLGSVMKVYNGAGQIEASNDYDAYGNTSSVSKNGKNADMRYAGMYYDAPTGLYLTLYRAYDPATARWMSRDPIEENGGINLYTYVNGNPISLVDPYGLAAEFEIVRNVAPANLLNMLSNTPTNAPQIPGEYVGVNFPWSMPNMIKVCDECQPEDPNTGSVCHSTPQTPLPELTLPNHSTCTCTKWHYQLVGQ